MKRLLSAIICCLFICSLAACKKEDGILLGEEDWDAQTSNEYGIIEVTAEKDAFNYLTGEYNMARDRVGTRPICVAVNNIAASWPQSGISQADVIIEIETEVGITRLMAMFADTREVKLIGSVRSLRDPFIEAVYQIDPIIVHIGTSIYANKVISERGMETIDGNYQPKAIYVNSERMSAGYSSEHTRYTSGKLIYNASQDLRLSEKSQARSDSFFSFAAPGEFAELLDGEARQVNFRFSDDQYDGDFRYDMASGSYLKFQRGQAQLDVGDGSGGVQLAFKNVLVLFASIETVDPSSGVVSVNYTDGGEGYYFSEGRFERITWEKPAFESGFLLAGSDGSELILNAGKTMLNVVGDRYADTLEIDGEPAA
jgi:hypothetical protein